MIPQLGQNVKLKAGAPPGSEWLRSTGFGRAGLQE